VSHQDAAPPRTGKTAERLRRTRAALVDEARRRTAEVGLSGFTVDELCSAVGVSRRTFFNHFASKDDVVVGVAVDDDDALLAAYASSRRDPRLPPLSTVVDDLAGLAVAQIRHVGLTRDGAAAFRAALEREPRLLAAVMRQGEAHRRRLVEAVASHESLDADDLRLGTVVSLLAAVVGRACERFFVHDGADGDRFDDVLDQELAAVRALVLPSSPLDRKAP
jgi:AcrR family transcriptional regulator